MSDNNACAGPDRDTDRGHAARDLNMLVTIHTEIEPPEPHPCPPLPPDGSLLLEFNSGCLSASLQPSSVPAMLCQPFSLLPLSPCICCRLPASSAAPSNNSASFDPAWPLLPSPAEDTVAVPDNHCDHSVRLSTGSMTSYLSVFVYQILGAVQMVTLLPHRIHSFGEQFFSPQQCCVLLITAGYRVGLHGIFQSHSSLTSHNHQDMMVTCWGFRPIVDTLQGCLHSILGALRGFWPVYYIICLPLSALWGVWLAVDALLGYYRVLCSTLGPFWGIMDALREFVAVLWLFEYDC
ncbi:hypothetical protein C8J57DRAFT_1731150, partial [Mycena rebaudengoi]